MAGPALDDVYDALEFSRRKLNHDLLDLGVPGDELDASDLVSGWL
jgi:hypothetical protein